MAKLIMQNQAYVNMILMLIMFICAIFSNRSLFEFNIFDHIGSYILPITVLHIFICFITKAFL